MNIFNLITDKGKRRYARVELIECPYSYFKESSFALLVGPVTRSKVSQKNFLFGLWSKSPAISAAVEGRTDVLARV